MNANTKNSQVKHCPCPKCCDKTFLKKLYHKIFWTWTMFHLRIFSIGIHKGPTYKIYELKKHLKNNQVLKFIF